MATEVAKPEALVTTEGGKTSFPLHGRHALVTGGGRGIGAEIAERLASLGAMLTLVSRSVQTLAERARALEAAFGGKVATAVADVTDAAAFVTALDVARAAYGAPVILMNNAGNARSASFLKTDRALWDEISQSISQAPISALGPPWRTCSRQAGAVS